jgi:MFS family permease
LPISAFERQRSRDLSTWSIYTVEMDGELRYFVKDSNYRAVGIFGKGENLLLRPSTIIDSPERMKPIFDSDLVPAHPPNEQPAEPTEIVEPMDTQTERGFLPVLKNPNFLALWSGQVFSQLADKVYLVLAIAIIASQFQAEDRPISVWVSAITIAFTIPAILFGFLAGVFVDRWPKKQVLAMTNLLRGALVLALPPLLWVVEGQTVNDFPLGFAVLLIVTFLISTLTQFFAPAEQATIPLIVDRKHLLSANSLYTTTMLVAAIVGFAIGDPLLAMADRLLGNGNYGKEIAVGGSYAIAGLLLLLVRTREPAKPAASKTLHFWQDLKEGWNFLNSHPRVRSASIELIVLFCVFAALTVLTVRLAEVMPALNTTQFGVLLAAAAAGMALGALIVGHYGSRWSNRVLSFIGSLGMSACLAAMSVLTQRLIPSLLAIGGLGVCAALVAIPMQTTIQAETPEEMRGKVFGLQNNAVNIALSLPLALAGLAETYFGLRVVFLALAAMGLVSSLINWYLSQSSR